MTKKVRFTIAADTLDLEDDLEIAYAEDLTDAEMEERIKAEFAAWLDDKIKLVRAAAEYIVGADGSVEV